MSVEEWRDINGYVGLYQISNLGNVKSIERKRFDSKHSYAVHEKILSQPLNAYGYPVVSLHKDGKSKVKTVHRLVANAFIPNPENKLCVDHINGIRNDNRLENLRWATHKDNSANMIRLNNQVKFKDRSISDDAKKRMLRNKRVVRSDGKKYESVLQAARDLGYQTSKMVIKNLKGRVDSVRGFTFSYAIETRDE